MGEMSKLPPSPGDRIEHLEEKVQNLQLYVRKLTDDLGQMIDNYKAMRVEIDKLKIDIDNQYQRKPAPRPIDRPIYPTHDRW